MTRFYEGYGTVKDIDNMRYLAENMLGRTFCPLGDAAAMPMIGFFQKFRDEFEEYIKANPAAPESQALVELVGA
jgi:NADH-quinone oxidoreductase subunit F